MKKQEIISKVMNLKLPSGSFVVYGSCPMAVHGIRDARDIDLYVSAQVYGRLKITGWREVQKSLNDRCLVEDVFEAHKNWDFSPYNPTLEDLLSSATMVSGIPFASLEEVRKWKVASRRPQDLSDIALIDDYFSKADVYG